MQLDFSNSARWVRDFYRRWQQGKNILLHGAVFDRFLVNGTYWGLQDFLPEWIEALGYDIVVEFDSVDGLRFRSPEMEAAGRELLGVDDDPAAPSHETAAGSVRASRGSPATEARPAQRAQGTSPAPDQRTRKTIAVDDDPPPPASRASSAPPSSSRAPVVTEFADALRILRRLVSQVSRSVAVVIYYCDRLFGADRQQNAADRPLLVSLMKTLQEASLSEVPGGEFEKRNLVTLVATDLSYIPDWLLLHNPLLQAVEVGPPSTSERMDFVRRQASQFYRPAAGSAPDESVLIDFANLTDGFSWWDLDALRRASQLERIPLDPAKKLVDYVKFGESEDPWEALSSDRVRDAQQQLSQRVIGQERAIAAVVRMIKSAKENISMSGGGLHGRPKGVFFFVGPTGTGKTELAKAITQLIFSDESAFARFDMSEFSERQAAEKLAGAPPGYVGFDEGGQLTNRVRQRPFSLLLFDEIEKAHPSVMDKFLQILEDGRLTDGKGRTTYFSQTVIIFTSNIGSDDLETRDQVGQLVDYASVESHYVTQVERHFRGTLGRPELYNRLGANVLVFDILRPDYLAGIYTKFVRLLQQSLYERKAVQLLFPDASVSDLIIHKMQEPENLAYGGRRIRTLLEDLVEKPLNDWVFDHPHVQREIIAVAVNGGVQFTGQ